MKTFYNSAGLSKWPTQGHVMPLTCSHRNGTKIRKCTIVTQCVV